MASTRFWSLEVRESLETYGFQLVLESSRFEPSDNKCQFLCCWIMLTLVGARPGETLRERGFIGIPRKRAIGISRKGGYKDFPEGRL